MRALILAGALGLACSGDKEAELDPGKAEPKAALDAAITFDANTFCDEVFPESEVEKVVGARLGSVVIGQQPKGGMMCSFAESAAGDESGSEPADRRLKVSLSVLCAAGRHGAKQADLVRAMAKEGDEFVELSLGKGGGKVHLVRYRTRFLAYRHGKLPCDLTVDLREALDDHLADLVALVERRLTASNRPR